MNGTPGGRPRVALQANVGFWEILAFTCESAALVATAIGGWHLATSVPVQLLAAVALPVTLAVVWGRWLAPQARRRLRGAALSTAKLAVFAAAAVVLGLAGQPLFGIALFAISALDVAVLARRPGSPAA